MRNSKKVTLIITIVVLLLFFVVVGIYLYNTTQFGDANTKIEETVQQENKPDKSFYSLMDGLYLVESGEKTTNRGGGFIIQESENDVTVTIDIENIDKESQERFTDKLLKVWLVKADPHSFFSPGILTIDSTGTSANLSVNISKSDWNNFVAYDRVVISVEDTREGGPSPEHLFEGGQPR